MILIYSNCCCTFQFGERSCIVLLYMSPVACFTSMWHICSELLAFGHREVLFMFEDEPTKCKKSVCWWPQNLSQHCLGEGWTQFVYCSWLMLMPWHLLGASISPTTEMTYDMAASYGLNIIKKNFLERKSECNPLSYILSYLILSFLHCIRTENFAIAMMLHFPTTPMFSVFMPYITMI